ncbi:MAG TPA: SIR2 family protein, partial [Candidatus Faecousia intestinigallinarum]|nr:SIR2 family protein [Candidatus Faecousia intestinigallinarum]
MLVPYIGAGMSAFIYPTWSSTIKIIADEVDDEKKREEIKTKANEKPIDAAEELVKTIGYGNLTDIMLGIFGKEDYDKNLLRQGAVSVLPQLFSEGYIITTNYDRLLESVFSLSGDPFEFTLTPFRVQAVKTAHQQGLHVLFKLHGDLSHNLDEDIILTKAQY